MKSTLKIRNLLDIGVTNFLQLNIGGKLLFYLIPLFILSMLIIYPAVSLIKLSFAGSLASVVSSYTKLLSEHFFIHALLTSLKLSLISTLLTTILGVCIAMVMHYTDFIGKSFLLRGIELMVAFPSFVIAFSLIFLYGSEGLFTLLIEGLFHAKHLGINFIYGEGGIILAEVIYYMPFIIRPTLDVLEFTDSALEEAALSLGATTLTVFRKIILPLSFPGIAAGAILCFLFIQNEFGILLVLGSLGVQTLPMLIYNSVTVNLDLKSAAMEAVSMSALSLIVYSLYRVLLSKAKLSLKSHVITMRSKRVNFKVITEYGRRVWYPTIFVFLIVVTVIFVMPLVVILLSAIAKTWSGSIFPTGYTLKWLANIGSSDLTALGNSLLVALSVATLSTVTGTAAALYIQKCNNFFGTIIDYLVMLPIVVPSVVIGLGVLVAFHSGLLNLSGSPSIVVLAQFILTLPFSYRIISAAVSKVPKIYDEAASGLGSGHWRSLCSVTIPLLSSGIKTSFALSFAFSIGELGATIMVYPPGFITAPIDIIQYIARGFYYQGSALTLMMLVITFCCLLIIGFAGKTIGAFILRKQKAKVKNIVLSNVRYS